MNEMNTSNEHVNPLYNTEEYDNYAMNWKRDNRNRINKAPWAFVTYTKIDGSTITQRRRIYLNCREGEMFIDKNQKRRYFTGPQADSRLTYVLCG